MSTYEIVLHEYLNFYNDCISNAINIFPQFSNDKNIKKKSNLTRVTQEYMLLSQTLSVNET